MAGDIAEGKTRSPKSGRTFVVAAIYALSVGGGLWNAFRGYPPLMEKVMPVLFVAVALAAFLLMYKLTVRNVLTAMAVTVIIFCAEVAGVNLGFPFGDYAYTSSLGTKVLDVPVVIPLFWLTVIISSWSASDRVLKFKHIIVASIMVTAFDAVLEFAADSLSLWHWEGGAPTELNFISRFALAYLGLSILQRYAAERESTALVPHLLIVQLLYFAVSDVGIRFFAPLS